MHRTIGIVGGLSPESTANYYLSIVRKHYQHFGEHRYPRIKISSVCYQQYTDWRLNNQWDIIAKNLTAECHELANAGADFALIACNAMHKSLPLMQSPIPILSIFDVIAAAAQNLAIDTLVLTGTQFTMTDGFFTKNLEAHGIKVMTPDAQGQAIIERIIRTELTLGTVSQKSAAAFIQAIKDTISPKGSCEKGRNFGVLLACTELGMLIPYLPSDFQYLDTASLHAMSAWKISTGQLSPYWKID